MVFMLIVLLHLYMFLVNMVAKLLLHSVRNIQYFNLFKLHLQHIVLLIND